MTIDLSKSSTLSTSNGAVPDELHLSFSFKVPKGKGLKARAANALGSKLDLDAMVIAFNKDKLMIGYASPENEDAFARAIAHQGDNKAKAGDTATETIVVKPSQLPTDVNALVFTVVSIGQAANFQKVSELRFIASDGTNELGSSYISIEEGSQGKALYKIVRSGSGWVIEPFMALIGNVSSESDVAAKVRDLV